MTFNIYGCCVSREPVEALLKKRNDVIVNQYVAFINPVSLCSPKNTKQINIEDLNDLPTHNFRKRNLYLDINGKAFEYLFAKESDYIIIDTWDFRLPMIQKDDCYITIDPVTIHRNASTNSKFGWNDHKHIFYYDVTDEQYNTAIDKLCEKVLEHYRPEQIILMDSYAVTNYFDEAEKKIYFYKQADLDAIDMLNARVKAHIDRLKNNFGNCHCITFPSKDKVYGASDAKWGIMWLHYWDLYYEYAANAIDIVTQQLPAKEEIKRLKKLKEKYEYDSDYKIKDTVRVPKSEINSDLQEKKEFYSSMNRSELIQYLKNTREICEYLECIQLLKDDVMILLSTRHTAGPKISDEVLKKFHTAGFVSLSKVSLLMYAGIISRGRIVLNKLAEKAMLPVKFNGSVDGLNIAVISQSWEGGLLSSVTVNGEEFSLNSRGLNIVVYDFKSNAVIDSINYDAYGSNAVLFHKNLSFNENFFDSHFFISEKYKEIWRAQYQKRYLSNRKLNVKEIENGIILPNKSVNDAVYGGVCTEKFEFVAGFHTAMPDINTSSRHIVGCYNVSDSEIEYVDETVVYGGTLMDHPGHLLCEAFVDRIWWYLKNNFGFRLAVVCIWGDGSNSFQKEYLNLFGITNEDVIIVDKPTKFKKIIIPDQSEYPYKTSSLVPYEYTLESVSVFDQLKKKAPDSNYKKIYFTKSKTSKGNIVGEDFFIKFFREKGFEIIDPEDYTLPEKIGFLKNADEFATLFGTNSCYAVFCKPTVKLTILSRNNGFLMETQAMLNEIAGITDYYCVDTSMNIFGANLTFGLTLVGATDCFRRYVKQYFNEDLNISADEFMRRYLYDYCKKFPDYYSNSKFFNYIKEQKMITILQNMSEVFLGRDFDTSKLNLSTNESNLQNQVKDLTTQKSTLTTQINTLTEENKSLKSIKSQNETEIVKLRSDQNKLNAELVDAHRQKDEADKKIVELFQQMDEIYQQKYEAGKKLLAATEEKIALISDISIKKHQIDTLASELADTKEKIQSFEQECAELKNKINELENSRSWRITKPLRSIMWFFRRLLGKS